jgi:WD40 repeat protein/Flp pilus assembly protein TadD
LAAAFSPDGLTLLTGGGDPAGGKGEAWFWDVAAGRPRGLPLPHPGAVQAVAYGPDGRSVLTACTDHNARLWEAAPRPVVPALAEYEQVLALSPTGTAALREGGSKQPRLCDAATGQPLGPPLGQPGEGVAAFLGGDGTRVLTVSPGQRFPKEMFEIPYRGRLWDAAGGKEVGAALVMTGQVQAAAVSRDGRRILTAHYYPYGAGGVAQFWDAASGEKVGKPVIHKQTIRVVAFSPDGGTAVVASDDHKAQLYDAATGKPLGEPLEHQGAVRAATFSPDGRLLATGSDDRTARVHRALDGRPVTAPLPAHGEVRAVAFSPDGRRLVSGSDDKTARLWDVTTGKPVGPELEHEGEVRAVAFSPDGQLVLTGSYDRTARLWEANTGCPVGAPLLHRGPVLSAYFGPGGRTVVTHSWDREGETARLQKVGGKWERPTGTGWDGTGRVWAVPAPLAGSRDQVAHWAQVLTGLELDADNVVRPLDAAALAGKRQALRDEAGPSLAGEEGLSWHRREAEAAEARGRWFAAHWHLQRLVDAGPPSGGLYTRRGRALAALGRLEPAREDANQAARMLPGTSAPLVLRGEVSYLGGRWKEAIGHLTEALAVEKGDPEVWYLRGSAHAELGDWERAAADLAKAAELPDAPLAVAADQALLGLQRRDAAGYARACDALLKRSGLAERTPAYVPRPEAGKPGTQRTYFDYTEQGQLKAMTQVGGAAPVVTTFDYAGQYGPLASVTQQLPAPRAPYPVAMAARLAWVCSLAPATPETASAAVNLAGAAAEANPRSYVYARSLGAALVRAGQHEAAVRQLKAAAGLRQTPSPSVWLFLALAHQRLGQQDEARRWLEQAAKWIDDAHKRKPDAAGGQPTWDGLPWTGRLALEALRGEAENELQR